MADDKVQLIDLSSLLTVGVSTTSSPLCAEITTPSVDLVMLQSTGQEKVSKQMKVRPPKKRKIHTNN